MKFILRNFFILLLFFITVFTASAYDFESAGYQFNIISYSDFTCSISKYVGEETIIEIPSSIEFQNNNLSVIELEYRAFYNSQIISVVIPQSIEEIRSECFANCQMLEKVTLPSNLSFIRDNTFSGCINLKEILLPEKLIRIGNQAFYNCSLMDLTIPPSIEIIGDYAFSGNSFTSFEWPKNLNVLQEGVLKDCKDLKNIKLSENLEEIGKYAFSGCESLSEIILPQNINSLGGFLFENCKNLKEINIPSQIKTLPKCIFKGCSSLSKVSFNNGLNTIEYGAFEDCSMLEELTFPSSLTKLVLFYKHTYKNQSDGKIYSKIENELFKNCSINKLSIEKGDSLTFYYYYQDGSSGNYFLENNPELPKSIKKFECDRDLLVGGSNKQIKQTVTGPYGEKYEQWYGRVEYTYKPTSINLTEIEILELGYNIKTLNFINWNLPKLTQLICYNPTPPAFPSLTNDEIEYLKTAYTALKVYVPYGSKEKYKNTEIWKNFWNIEELSGIDAEQIILNIESTELNIGENIQIDATVLPENTTDKSVTWQSSNNVVATVNESGLVTAISDGAATITATNGNISASCQITVLTPIVDAEQIVLNLESAELNIGETVQLEATVMPEDTTDPTVIWSSSNEEVASVSEDGLVSAVSEGSAIITATCGEVSAECAITVLEDASVESLLANPNSVVSIYAMDGILLKKGVYIEEIKTLSKGFYIIKTGNNSYKIVL